MKSPDWLTKILAVVGVVLVWFPILAPVVLGMWALIARGRFRLDFLMPAELSPVLLVGSGLLIWAALRAHSRLKHIGWSIGVAIAALVGSQGLAVVTGLASGATPPTGWEMVAVLAIFGIFLLALVSLAVGGALLVRDLFGTSRSA